MFPVQLTLDVTGASKGRSKADLLLWAIQSRIAELVACSVKEDPNDPDSDYYDLVHEADRLRELQNELMVATFEALEKANQHAYDSRFQLMQNNNILL